MPKFKQKLIQQIKQLSDLTVQSITEFIFLLSQILNQKVNFFQIYKYVQDVYTHSKKYWKNIQTPQLLRIYQEAIQCIIKNRNEWNKINQLAKKQLNDLIQQKKKLKKLLKQKSLTKLQLIDSYIQQIRRNKVFFSKAKDLAQSSKFQQNIDLLQKKIQIMKNESFQNENQLVKTQEQTYEAKIQQLIQLANQFQSKKQSYQYEEIIADQQNIIANSIKISKATQQLAKKIKNIYTHYCKENYNSSQTFQINTKNFQTMNLRLFLKYYKNLFADKKEEKHQVQKITNIFKKHAFNGKNINFHKFMDINSEIFEFSFNGKLDQNLKIEELKEQQKQQKKELIESKIKKLQRIKIIFSQQKINQILNKCLKTTSVSKQKKNYSNLNKIIDKNQEDYSQTKKAIYQQFKHNIFQNQHFTMKQINNHFESKRNFKNKKQNIFLKNQHKNKQIFDTIIEQANSQYDSYSKNPQNINFSRRIAKNSKSSLSLRTNSQFTLPKITRLSQQRIQSQSIYKSIEYLNGVLSKKQEEKIKKIVNYQRDMDSNKLENIFLKEFFNNQKQACFQHQKETLQQKNKKTLQKKSCPKFKSSDYQPFMKF